MEKISVLKENFAKSGKFIGINEPAADGTLSAAGLA